MIWILSKYSSVLVQCVAKMKLSGESRSTPAPTSRAELLSINPPMSFLIWHLIWALNISQTCTASAQEIMLVRTKRALLLLCRKGSIPEGGRPGRRSDRSGWESGSGSSGAASGPRCTAGSVSCSSSPGPSAVRGGPPPLAWRRSSEENTSGGYESASARKIGF